MTEKVLEKLGTTESTTLALSRETDGKIRVTSLLWEAPKVILRGEVLEARNVDGRLHIARKPRHHDDQCLSAVNVNIELFCAAARGGSAVDMTENVLEKLGTTEGTTLALKRENGGKIRVVSLLWEAPKVILRNEVLEIRNVDGVLHIARNGPMPMVPVSSGVLQSTQTVEAFRPR
jgi:hypothetical protein